MDVTLIIDNYDSFVYNIAQLVAELGSTPIVVRNDELTFKSIKELSPTRIIISPGPGTPERRRDVGVSLEVVRKFAGKLPILGICLGHQMIGYAFGAKVRRAKSILHGKIDKIRILRHSKILAGLPSEIEATRYNSLAIDSLPSTLLIDAISLTDGEIMAISHVERPVFGVQFHPESVGTKWGTRILKNFLNVV
ncbi:MAG: aminodeoxychorismate/anthranilate synthase component II [Candidatus Verstraetearchaeota archaeon]|nr:aminodeoxychorismate/anthranilate synthase component II [Candidatus Verstraetearchaeota archaeon]